MTAFEIPLSPSSQVFNITLAGLAYRLTVKWNNDPDVGGWYMDIQDSSSNLLIGGVPLITGANLIEQYDYLGIGGKLYVQTDHNTDAVPTYENLGINSHLYFVAAP